MKNLHLKIKELRDKANLTAKDLAEKAELSPAYISKLESGEYKTLSLKTCKQLAGGLSISLREFLEALDFLNNKEQPSFGMITNAFRSIGYTPEQVGSIISYAKWIKEHRVEGRPNMAK